MRVRGACFGLLFAAAGAVSCNNSTEGPVPTILVVSPDPVALTRNDSVKLSVAVFDRDSILLSGIPVTFASSDTTVVTVSNAGQVRSRTEIDTATISVTAAGLTKKVRVTVFAIPAAIQVAPLDTTIRQGSSYQLRAAVVDARGDTIPGEALTYQSTNPAVATITAGLVTGFGIGTAALVAQSGGLQASALVRVRDSSLVATVPVSGCPYGIAVASNGVGYVTQICGDAITRIDVATHTTTGSISTAATPAHVALNPAGTKAVVANQVSQLATIVDVATNTIATTLPLTGHDGFNVRVSLDGSQAWVTTGTGMVFVLDGATFAKVDSVQVGAAANGLAFHPTLHRIYISSISEGTVSEIDTDTRVVLRVDTLGGMPQRIAVSPDGSELYAANEVSGVDILDLTTHTVSSIPIGGPGLGLALTPAGDRLWVSSYSLGAVKVLNPATRGIVRTIITGGDPRNIAIAADGTVLVANQSGWIDFIK